MDADPRDVLIEQLRAENARLVVENAELRETIRRLERRLEELERQAHRSAAPFRRDERKKKPPDQHGRPGRKPGHPPAYRVRPDHIDEEIDVPLTACPRCGGAVLGVDACEQFIEDLPPIRPRVTHLVTYAGLCPRCGPVRSTHPIQVSTASGAAGTHLGSRALALGAQLNKQFGITTRNCVRILKALGGLPLTSDVKGLHITPGGLTQAMHRMARKARNGYDDLVVTLRRQPSVHADETSWWVGGPGHWLWGFTCPACTVYHVDTSRGRALDTEDRASLGDRCAIRAARRHPLSQGRDVVLDMLGDDFGGVLVSDCLASYENLPYTMQKCYVHHLRAIAESRERAPPESHADFDQLAALLKAAVLLKKLRPQLPAAEYARRRAGLDATAERLLAAPTGPAAKVALRLRKRRRWLFTFLDHEGVPADNNAAERALRPAVIARKLSCGNKTPRGKDTWQILASLTATCRQTARDFVEALRPHLVLASANTR